MARSNYDSDDEAAMRVRSQWQRGIPGYGAAIILAVLVVVVFSAGYMVLHHGNRSAIFQSQADANGATAKANPSPAIPWSAKPQIAPPATIAPLPADSVPSSIPAAIADPSSPETAHGVVRAKDTEGVYLAKHQKSFGRGCDGKLELTATGLDFTCTSGSDAPLHFASAQIKGANGNGIELKTGEKFHFDLRRGKAEEQQIFRNWTYTHVPGAYVAAN